MAWINYLCAPVPVPVPVPVPAQGGLMIGAPMFDGYFLDSCQRRSLRSLSYVCSHCTRLRFAIVPCANIRYRDPYQRVICVQNFLFDQSPFLSVTPSFYLLLSTEFNMQLQVQRRARAEVVDRTNRFGYPCTYHSALSLRIGCMFARHVD